MNNIQISKLIFFLVIFISCNENRLKYFLTGDDSKYWVLTKIDSRKLRKRNVFLKFDKKNNRYYRLLYIDSVFIDRTDNLDVIVNKYFNIKNNYLYLGSGKFKIQLLTNDSLIIKNYNKKTYLYINDEKNYYNDLKVFPDSGEIGW